MDSLDTWLTIIDIIICLFDIGLIVYLFFYRFPQENKKKNNFKKFFRSHGRKRNRIR